MKVNPNVPRRTPFYRDVKVRGALLQIAFALVVLAGAFVIVRNVTTGLQSSNVPFSFSFLSTRAGIPIAESLIAYNPDDRYLRAFLVGILNTLRVAVFGILVAAMLGIVIGVMRLSRNYILRTVATMYVELVRNTPLALQLVFWYTAILTPLPKRILNAVTLPGGILVSNQGIALPWPYPSYAFGRYLPMLGAAVLLGGVTWAWRRTTLRRTGRLGNGVLPALLVSAVIAISSYWLIGPTALPNGAATSFREVSGIVTSFIDTNGDGVLDARDGRLPHVAISASVNRGLLSTNTKDLVESRAMMYSTFRFPPIRSGEFENAEVTFSDPAAAAAAKLRIHFQHFPSVGVVYVDKNGNGVFDVGEEINGDQGYQADLVLTVTGFKRRIVTNRVGEARIPRFVADLAKPVTPSGQTVGPTQLFAPPATGEASAALDAEFTLTPAWPLVWSRPSVAVSTYEGGITLTNNYLALLIAVIVHFASFIAEIVRGGLQAIPKGQTEAAKALGLSNRQVFAYVVFPQALRIILPPSINQFLNLTKATALAPLVGYGELFAISTIIANQSGASVPIMLLLLVTYLIISAMFAALLNVVNVRMALVAQ